MVAILITREIDYAIRIVRTLEWNGQQAAVEIAEKEGIPLPFAYKILKKLAKAEIVKIYRGASGGYQLLRPSGDLNLLDVAKAMDDEILITECMDQDYRCSSQQSQQCTVHREFLRIQQVLEREMSSKSISELLKS